MMRSDATEVMALADKFVTIHDNTMRFEYQDALNPWERSDQH